jgi:hypothetical protein
MVDVDIDAEVRLKFLEKRSVQLQNALLQIEVDTTSAEAQVENLKVLAARAKAELEKLRPAIVRAKAEIEEKKGLIKRD